MILYSLSLHSIKLDAIFLWCRTTKDKIYLVVPSKVTNVFCVLWCKVESGKIKELLVNDEFT